MRVVELEMPLVVKLEQGWAVRMLLLQVDVVNLRLLGRVSTVLTHVNLLPEKSYYKSRISSFKLSP